MLQNNLQAIVLAAGKSTRFKTDKTKLIEKICGQEMILFTTKLLEKMKLETTIIVGHQKEIVKTTISEKHQSNIHFVHQNELLGTGHAVSCTKSFWKKQNILILNGDMPIITEEIIDNLYKEHIHSDAAISFVISHYPGSDHAYGRVIEDKNGIKIVEAKDFKEEIREDHCWINAGIYIAKKEFLQNCIQNIEKSAVTNEFYITSLIEMANNQNLKVTTSKAAFDRIRGVNTFEELWAAEQIKRADLIKYWMKQGVRFHVAQNIHIDIDVQIGAGTQIGSGVHLLSGTKVGKNCSIKKFSTIENAIIEDNVMVLPNCIIRDSYICKNAQIGPFAHIHSQSKIEEEAMIGNFVEIKKSIVGKQTFAKHLTYLGNATIGSKVNIGAGTITCNHNGIEKNETIIKNNAYIGSNNTLVAPVTIEQNAFTAAGSTITEDVPKNCLSIGRAKQINKENYVQKLFEKLKKRSDETNKKENNSCSYIGSLKTKNRKIEEKT